MKSRKFKWGNPLFVAFLAIAGIFGVSASLVEANINPKRANADYTNFYMIGSGSFVEGTDWTTAGGVRMVAHSGDKGALYSQYLEAGDILRFINTDNTEQFCAYGHIVSGGKSTNFEATNYANGAQTMVSVGICADNVSWWGDGGGTSVVNIWDNDNVYASNVNIGAKSGFLEVSTAADGATIKIQRSNNAGDNGSTTIPLDFATNSNAFWINKGDNVWISDGSSDYYKNIKVKETGYYDIYINGSLGVWINTAESIPDVTVTKYCVNSSTGATLQSDSDTFKAENNYSVPSFETITGYTKPSIWTIGSTSGATYSARKIYKNTSLYAAYVPKTYTVTLDENGGTAATESVTTTYDAAMPSATMPTRSGYNFKGYYTSGGVQYYTNTGASAKAWDIDSDTTLYARWRRPSGFYLIGKGGINDHYGDFLIDEAVASGGSGEGCSAKFEGVKLDARAEFKIVYYDENTGEISRWFNGGFNGESTNINHSWSKPYADNNIVCSTAGIYKIYLSNAADDNYKTVSINMDVSLSCYTVVDGVVTSIGSVTGNTDVKYSKTFTDLSVFPSVTGRAISAYYSDDDCTSPIDAANSKPSGTEEVYAEYTLVDYNITYNTNGGTIHGDYSASYNYGIGAHLPTNVTKSGYAFSGWHVNSDLSDEAVSAIGTSETGNKIFYASWETEGLYGGETFYFLDEGGMFSEGSGNAHLRIRLWDAGVATEVLTRAYTSSDVLWQESGHNLYSITIPEYTGTHPCGWSQFIVLRYHNDQDSDTVINWSHVYNQSPDLSASYWKGFNCWKDTGYSTDGWNRISMTPYNMEARQGFATGEVAYFEPGTTFGIQSTGHLAVYFFGAVGYADATYSAWVVMDVDAKKVLGTGSDYSNGLWEFIVPSPDQDSSKSVVWHKFIIVELKPGVEEGSWGDGNSNVQHKSSDLSFTTNYNTIKGIDTMNYSLNPSTRLDYFVAYFNSQTDPEQSGACRYDGGGSSGYLDNLKTAWSNCRDQFPIEHRVETLFKEVSSTGDNPENKAASRYDYIVYKYGADTTNFDDFADRADSEYYSYKSIGSLASYKNFFGGSVDNLSTIIIIVASSVALLSVTALSILVIKKRKNKEE